jgi:hypothetical protein
MARAQAGETFCIAPLLLVATALVAEADAEEDMEEGAMLMAVDMAVAIEEEARLIMEDVVGTAE